MATETQPLHTREHLAPTSPDPHETEMLLAPWLDPIIDALPLIDHRTRRRAMPTEVAAPGRYLALTDGDETLLVELEREVTHIGRGFTADLRIEDHHVSRRHAILVQRGARVRVLDDRSANGTFVNGRRIVESELRDGDVVLIGPVALRYVEVTLTAEPRTVRR
ncbi:MAG TPA: FHA domain-containing protein [Solirubrobacteraceae bacterium]|nr:FHA domain-containing protein [Solirubrobacteraceae bacterium]